jgi:hypothetical protein
MKLFLMARLPKLRKPQKFLHLIGSWGIVSTLDALQNRGDSSPLYRLLFVFRISTR